MPGASFVCSLSRVQANQISARCTDSFDTFRLSMATFKPCFRLVGKLSPHDTFQSQKPLKTRHIITRLYSHNGNPKPRPYNEIPTPASNSRPLVGTKPVEKAQSSSIANPGPASAPPPPNPKAGGVAYPYLRISLGVVLCGSIIYSMVIQLLTFFLLKLNYMHASSPRPSNSNPPPSPTEISSQSKSPV